MNEATELLSNYNTRLQQELKDRKKLGKMLSGNCHIHQSKYGGRKLYQDKYTHPKRSTVAQMAGPQGPQDQKVLSLIPALDPKRSVSKNAGIKFFESGV